MAHQTLKRAGERTQQGVGLAIEGFELAQEVRLCQQRRRRLDQIRHPPHLELIVLPGMLPVEDDRHFARAELAPGEAVEIHPVIVRRARLVRVAGSAGRAASA